MSQQTIDFDTNPPIAADEYEQMARLALPTIYLSVLEDDKQPESTHSQDSGSFPTNQSALPKFCYTDTGKFGEYDSALFFVVPWV